MRTAFQIVSVHVNAGQHPGYRGSPAQELASETSLNPRAPCSARVPTSVSKVENNQGRHLMSTLCLHTHASACTHIPCMPRHACTPHMQTPKVLRIRKSTFSTAVTHTAREIFLHPKTVLSYLPLGEHNEIVTGKDFATKGRRNVCYRYPATQHSFQSRSLFWEESHWRETNCLLLDIYGIPFIVLVASVYIRLFSPSNIRM